jgi:hypothetical protein
MLRFFLEGAAAEFLESYTNHFQAETYNSSSPEETDYNSSHDKFEWIHIVKFAQGSNHSHSNSF